MGCMYPYKIYFVDNIKEIFHMHKKIISLILVFVMLLPLAVFADGEVILSEVMTEKTFTASDGTVLPYRMYVPANYSNDKEYSFLVFLHGAGNRGNDNLSQIKENCGLIKRIIGGETVTDGGSVINTSEEFIIIAPQCAKDMQWVDTPWDKSPDPSYSLDAVKQSIYSRAVEELIADTAKNYNINSDRMYITGLSMGGFGVWDFLMRRNDLWAAAIPMGGASDLLCADIIKDTPVWTFHQYLDTVVLSQGTQNITKELVKKGAKVKFTPYFDLQHNAWTKGYAEPDMLQWLYDHKKDGIKVACVGDSITEGAGIVNAAVDSYPTELAKLLGINYEVVNFGKSACTALTNTPYPYIETSEYKASLAYNPDILCIMFGTNDIKDENWPEGKDKFIDEYKAIIDSYKKYNPSLKVFIGIPPEILKLNVYGERNPEILENEGIPKIKELASLVDAVLVDTHTALKGKDELFPDFLHPNEEGAEILAKTFANAIKASETPANIVSVVDGASDWAKDEIALSYAIGLVPATVKDNYTQNITRENFCEAVMTLFAGVDIPYKPNNFEDTSNIAVANAYSLGIVNGVSDTVFDPYRNITREEISVMLDRAFRKIADVKDEEFVASFPDAHMISDWAKTSVNFMNAQGIIKGDPDGSVRPQDNTTREEALLLVSRTYFAANTYFSKVSSN